MWERHSLAPQKAWTRSLRIRELALRSLLQLIGLCAVLIASSATKALPAALSSDRLAARIAAAAPGATIRVPAGIYPGPLVIDKPLTLLGEPGAIIDGGGRGTVVLIKASHVTFSGFTVRATGNSLDQENTGIMVLGSNEQILDDTLENVLFGIYLKASNNSLIADNHITGKALPLPIRGDAIRLWYCMNCRIQHNTISQARDIILWFSQHCQIENNLFKNGRYGLHLMYDRDLEITGNALTQNFVGAFLMYSWNITFKQNVLLANRGISGYGIGVKNINNLLAEDNRFLDNEVGIFMNSSPSSLGVTNVFRRNVVAFNDVGLSVDPSNQGNNLFTLNSFLENLQQVANTGGGALQGDSFAESGRGNFWSDYTGYPDRNRDIGAVPYQVRNLFDNLTDQYDRLKLFRFSPAEEAIDLAAAAFPLVQPHELLTDPDPLMSPVPVHAAPLAKPAVRGLAAASALLLGLAGLLAILPGIPIRRKMKKASQTMSKLDYPLLEIHSLEKSFGHAEVLHKVTVTVDRSQAVALWGDNGAGKSTTIKCIVGLLDYTGAITVAGLDARRDGKAVRRLIGYVPQELRFYNDWSIRRTMAFYADLKRASREEIPVLLEEVGLEPHADKTVAALSGGMKQRLALAIALLGRPEMLLLDEFTASLDAEARVGLLELLKEQRRKGLTVIFTTHRLDEVEALADRVEMMRGGEIRASVPLQEFLRRLEVGDGFQLEKEPSAVSEMAGSFPYSGVKAHHRACRLPTFNSESVPANRLMTQSHAAARDCVRKAKPMEAIMKRKRAEETRVPAVEFGNLFILARKEMFEALRNRWFLFYSTTFLVLTLSISFLSLAGADQYGFAGFNRTAAGLVNLVMLIVPLMALSAGAGSIAGERERGTLEQVLAMPVTRTELLMGKFLGVSFALVLALATGFGISAAVIVLQGGTAGATGYLSMAGLACLLAVGMLSVGLLISALTNKSGTAAGASIVVWLGLAFVSDLGLMGSAILFRLQLWTLFDAALANPLEVFKMATLSSSQAALSVLGPVGRYAEYTFGSALWLVFLGVLLAWIAVPLTLSWRIFRRVEAG